MKGQSAIPALQLAVLNKLISKMDKAPNMFFSNMIPVVKNDSDTILWETEYGSAGMTPFVAPGAPAPSTGLDGIGAGSAKAAYFKEKMYFDEEFLNNLRQVGTWATYQKAERQLAKGMQKLRRRIDRRREWMCAKMVVDGTMTYATKGGVKFTVDYGIPESHKTTPTYAWGASNSTPLVDVFDAKTVLVNDAGVNPDFAICNTSVLKKLLFDVTTNGIQNLLKKSNFGEGDLFRNPKMVIGTLLGVGELVVNDDLYEANAWILTTVTGSSSTTVTVDDATDFEVGTARLYNMLTNTFEDIAVTAVNLSTNVITFTVTTTSTVYLAGRDRIIMRKKYIADNKFILMTKTSADGDAIGEFMEAPYGLDRHWGPYADTELEWDPEGIWIRVQDKGLPVLYHNDCTYTLTI